jgi:hypothetical protein
MTHPYSKISFKIFKANSNNSVFNIQNHGTFEPFESNPKSIRTMKLHQTLFISLLAGGVIIGLNPILIHFLIDLLSNSFNTPFFLNFYNLKRLDELMVTLGTAVLLISFKELRHEFFSAWGFLPKSIQRSICLFFGLGLLSTVFAIHFEPAILELSHESLLFIFALTLSQQILHPKVSFVLKTSFAVSIGIYVLLALYSYQATYYHVVRGVNYSLDTLEYLTVYPQFLNPRFFSQVFVLTWPILLYLSTLTWKKKPGLSLLMLFINSYWITLGFENNSRAIFLSIGLALITLFFLVKNRIGNFHLWIKFLCASLLISILLSEILFSIGLKFSSPLISLLNHSEQLSHYTDRITLWLYTFSHFIIPHPLLGVGPLNFAAVPNSLGVAHPHNIILKIAAEWGVPAALIFCFILIKGLVGWLKFFKRNNSTHSIYLPKLLIQSTLTLILIGGVIDSMVSGSMVMPLSQLFLAIFWGWMYGICTEHHENIQDRTTPTTSQINSKDLSKQKLFIQRLIFKLCALSNTASKHKDLLLTSGLLISTGIILIITTHDFLDFSVSYQNFLRACASSHHCSLPPLFWFPEQVSPLNLWIQFRI